MSSISDSVQTAQAKELEEQIRSALIVPGICGIGCSVPVMAAGLNGLKEQNGCNTYED